MERFQKIVWHEKYKETYERLQQLEIDRKFCGHDIEHFLSVARISYLMILEKRLPVSKDIIYATALLHDLGRADQYEKGNFSRGSGSDSCRGDLNGLWIYQRREKVYDRYDFKA